MRKITEILRLDAQGVSQRQIARSTAVGKTTVAEYLARAKEAGLAWPLPEGLDDEALEAKLFRPRRRSPGARSPTGARSTES
jgi:transposase